MCGRYTLHSRLNLLLQQFAIESGQHFAPRFNIAPTQLVPVVRQSEVGVRSLASLRWGLVPSWAKDLSIGNRMINARAETIASKPSFRTAFRKRRCLVPADGYYEWKKFGSRKQPYYIRLRDSGIFAMAGLWEVWGTEPDAVVETFTIITTDANEATREIHDRMPVIVHERDYDIWLDPKQQVAERLQELLKPYDGPLQLDAVSTFVNSPRNDSEQCIAVQRELFE